jgi:hypothetical protein
MSISFCKAKILLAATILFPHLLKFTHDVASIMASPISLLPSSKLVGLFAQDLLFKKVDKVCNMIFIF